MCEASPVGLRALDLRVPATVEKYPRTSDRIGGCRDPALSLVRSFVPTRAKAKKEITQSSTKQQINNN